MVFVPVLLAVQSWSPHDAHHQVKEPLARMLLQFFGIHIRLGKSICSMETHHFPESVWAKGSSNSGGLLYSYTSSHFLIFSFSHLHIYTYHLLIFSSSHLLIFSSSHPLILSSSHPLILPLSLSLSPSLSLSLSPSITVSLLLFLFSRKPRALPTRHHEMATLSHEMRSRNEIRSSKNCGKICALRRQPFRTKWGSIVKNCGQIAIWALPRQPFRKK